MFDGSTRVPRRVRQASDGEQTRLAFDWTIRLKRAPAYDSYYLALAEIMGCDLWTADRRLCKAVNLSWIRVVGVDE